MTADDDVFRALSNRTRRLILEELADHDEQTLYELNVRLTMNHDVDMTRQGVSKHLDVLEESGLITTTRQGKYKVMEFAGTDPIGEVRAWLDSLAENDIETETEES